MEYFLEVYARILFHKDTLQNLSTKNKTNEKTNFINLYHSSNAFKRPNQKWPNGWLFRDERGDAVGTNGKTR